MLGEIVIEKEFRGFKPGDRFVFRSGVNLLVGDQGAGKSTLLAAVAAAAGFKRAFVRATAGIPNGFARVERVNGAPVRSFAFDFERDNPRVGSVLGGSEILPFEADLMSRFMSHGQFALKLLLPMAELREPRFVLLDEPDAGLSPVSALRFAAAMRAAAGAGAQIVAAVHNPWLIESFPEVLDVAARAWRPSSEFLDAQRALAAEGVLP